MAKQPTAPVPKRRSVVGSLLRLLATLVIFGVIGIGAYWFLTSSGRLDQQMDASAPAPVESSDSASAPAPEPPKKTASAETEAPEPEAPIVGAAPPLPSPPPAAADPAAPADELASDDAGLPAPAELAPGAPAPADGEVSIDMAAPQPSGSATSAGEEGASSGTRSIVTLDEPAAGGPVVKNGGSHEVVVEAPAAPPPAANGDKPYTVMQVFFATDRKRTGSAKPNDMYGSERGDLVFGSAAVSIPRKHKIGELEAPSIWKLEFSEDPEKHLVLLSAKEQVAAEYFKDIAARVAAAPDKSAFVFVHGFNVTFKDAARRTAQMTFDLKFPGAPVFYSWPSAGTMTGYTYDENNVIWTQSNLKRFLREFTTTSTAESIYLVAHSMGNRALTGAVKELMQEDPGIRRKIKEIILAAPDIDAEVFKRDVAPYIVTASPTVTLYASSNDVALLASKQVHGYARAGDAANGLTVIPGIDTIDSSNAETDFVGHAYYASSKSIISDIFHLIQDKQRPDKRPGLKPVESQPGRYWQFLGETVGEGN